MINTNNLKKKTIKSSNTLYIYITKIIIINIKHYTDRLSGMFYLPIVS